MLIGLKTRTPQPACPIAGRRPLAADPAGGSHSSTYHIREAGVPHDANRQATGSLS